MGYTTEFIGTFTINKPVSEAEKFYNYVEWIEYLINNLLKPKNYIVNGVVAYQGEDFDDFGTIFVRDNHVHHFPQLRKPLDSFQ